MEQPRPLGMWTVAHIAVDLNFSSVAYFRQVLIEPDCPKLVPTMRAGGLNLYSEAVYQEWKKAFMAWREGASARAAARRKQREDDAKNVNARVEAALAGWRDSAEGRASAARAEQMREFQQAQEQFLADREAHEAADRAAWERANGRR